MKASDIPYLDGTASIVIGVILAVVAVLLAREARGLLVGEGASSTTIHQIRLLVCTDPAVKGVLRVLTLYFGPEEVLLNLELQFDQNLSAEEVAEAIERVEVAIRNQYPRIKHIFIEAKSLFANRSVNHQQNQNQ